MGASGRAGLGGKDLSVMVAQYDLRIKLFQEIYAA